MRIDEIIASSDGPVFSFEFFPPKTDEGERNLRATLEMLRELETDFVSVTYGALGSTRDSTVDLTHWIKREVGIEAMAHLSCVGTTREELQLILEGMRNAGIENVLALRGDPPAGETDWKPHPGGLHYSTELATLIGGATDPSAVSDRLAQSVATSLGLTDRTPWHTTRSALNPPASAGTPGCPAYRSRSCPRARSAWRGHGA